MSAHDAIPTLPGEWPKSPRQNSHSGLRRKIMSDDQIVHRQQGGFWLTFIECDRLAGCIFCIADPGFRTWSWVLIGQRCSTRRGSDGLLLILYSYWLSHKEELCIKMYYYKFAGCVEPRDFMACSSSVKYVFMPFMCLSNTCWLGFSSDRLFSPHKVKLGEGTAYFSQEKRLICEALKTPTRPVRC